MRLLRRTRHFRACVLRRRLIVVRLRHVGGIGLHFTRRLLLRHVLVRTLRGVEALLLDRLPLAFLLLLYRRLLRRIARCLLHFGPLRFIAWRLLHFGPLRFIARRLLHYGLLRFVARGSPLLRLLGKARRLLHPLHLLGRGEVGHLR